MTYIPNTPARRAWLDAGALRGTWPAFERGYNAAVPRTVAGEDAALIAGDNASEVIAGWIRDDVFAGRDARESLYPVSERLAIRILEALALDTADRNTVELVAALRRRIVELDQDQEDIAGDMNDALLKLARREDLYQRQAAALASVHSAVARAIESVQSARVSGVRNYDTVQALLQKILDDAGTLSDSRLEWGARHITVGRITVHASKGSAMASVERANAYIDPNPGATKFPQELVQRVPAGRWETSPVEPEVPANV